MLGLWRGCWPNVCRAALVNLGDLSTYDSVKRSILDKSSLEDNTLTHTLSSACAGLVGAIMGTPADVVKARIMNQATDEKGRGLVYRNSLDCLLTTVREEGFFGIERRPPCYRLLIDVFCSAVQGVPALLAEDGSLVSHFLAFIRTNSQSGRS